MSDILMFILMLFVVLSALDILVLFTVFWLYANMFYIVEYCNVHGLYVVT